MLPKGLRIIILKFLFFEKNDINRTDDNIKATSIQLFDWMEKNEEKA